MKKYKKIKAYRKSVQKEPTDKRCLLLTLIWVGFLGIRFEAAVVVVVVVVGDWPKIRKLETHPSEFFPISGDWGAEIPNFTWMSLIKCYWMLPNARITAFIIFELSKENQQGVKLPPTPHPRHTHTQIRVN